MRKKHKDTGTTGADPGLPVRPGLTPIDIQQKEFRQQFRGYHMADVDAFLDELTEELAAAQEEIRRLRERAAGPAPLAGAPAAREEADRILREAREEAARIVRGVSVAGTAAGSGELGPFLTREREFLQALAGTIQQHAETVKAMARVAAERAQPVAEEQPAAEAATATEAPREAAPGRQEEGAPPGVGAIAGVGEVGEDTAAMPAVGTGERASEAPPAPRSPEAEPRVIRVDEPDEAEEDRPAGTAARRRDEHGSGAPEGSLRELFWGEEG